MSTLDEQVQPILTRFRRLATARRALVILEGISAILFTLGFVLEFQLPGILHRLFRGWVHGALVLAFLLVLLVLSQLGVVTMEWLMGRTLRVTRTPLRLATGILFLIPGVMIIRRVVQTLLVVWWLAMLCIALLVYILIMVIFFVPIQLSEGLARGFGRIVDAADQALSWLQSSLREGLRELIQSPVLHLENHEDFVLPLLQRLPGGAHAPLTGPAAEPSLRPEPRTP